MLAAQEFLFDLNPQLLFDAALLAIAVFFLYMLMSYLLFNPARKLLKTVRITFHRNWMRPAPTKKKQQR